MSKPLSVTVLDNGPLKVSGDEIRLRYCGEPIAVEAGKDVYLCRCGGSADPPFCDGTHNTQGFVAEPPAGASKELRVWEGRNIRTTFNPNACMHVFYCKPLKELRQRGLDGDDHAAAEIARVVMSCPSGALSYEAKAVSAPAVDQDADIDVMEGGEVRIQCAFQINTDLLAHQDGDRATLCRCGLSKNKPWCDGRHKKRADFR